MFRIYSNEKTKIAFDGTPEVPSPEMVRRAGGVYPDMPPQGLPAGHPVGLRGVIHHGVNEITDNEYALLNRDKHFWEAVDAGFIFFLNDKGATINPPPAPDYVPAPVSAPAGKDVVNEGAETLPEERTDAAGEAGDRTNPTTGEPANPRKPPPNNSNTNKTAPLKGAAPANADVEKFFAMSAEDRAAMYPALSPEEKALVDADPRSKA